MFHRKVIIVGGGPAGAASAWQLIRNGVDCLILDAQEFPREKLCAGWITPEVFDLLEVLPDDYPHALTRFNRFRITFPFGSLRLPVRQYAIRRVEFDHWLLERSGADMEQHRVKTITFRENRYWIDSRFSCDYLVGAGGTQCPVSRQFFSASNPRNPDRLIAAMEEEFAYNDTYGDCHLWFFRERLPGYAWYVPKDGGYVNVGLGASAAGLKKRGQSLKFHWESFILHLEIMGIVKDHTYHPKGHSYYLLQRGFRVKSGNAFIVGDSAGLATRDMGEGIRAAIQSGLLAADSILRNRAYSPGKIPKFSFPRILIKS